MKFLKLKNAIFVAVVLSAISAQADMVVIVSAGNSNAALNAEQVGRIFLGKTGTFPNGDSAIPIDQPKGDSRDLFYEKVTSKNRGQVNAYWSQLIFTGGGQPPKEASNEDEVVNLVSKNPNTIGYVEKSKINSAVKVILSVQ